MNIFEIIECATSRTEPFHSRFLAAALKESAHGDRSVFEHVWQLATPWEGEVPERPDIEAEFKLGQEGSIDVVIRSDGPPKRVVGIEVKTREESTEEGQLERYYRGLKDKFGCQDADLAIAFLTPFNRRRAIDVADSLQTVRAGDIASLPTVQEFDRFKKAVPSARHVSWLDVADISWRGNALWEQHREYVRKCISAGSLLKERRNRTLDYFFGHEAVRRFRDALKELGIDVGDIGADIDIDLSQTPGSAKGLAEALEALICHGEKISRGVSKGDGFDRRDRFDRSDFREVHIALFNLAASREYVWLEGKNDYAVRVAHDDYRGTGVSLIRSVGPKALRISGKR